MATSPSLEMFVDLSWTISSYVEGEYGHRNTSYRTTKWQFKEVYWVCFHQNNQTIPRVIHVILQLQNLHYLGNGKTIDPAHYHV